MAPRPGLIDQYGNALASPRQKIRAMFGGGGGAYDGADPTMQETRDWLARLASPSSEVHQDRDTLVARARDLVRNDGWASGAVTHILDATVGADLRLMAQPDWRALATWTGNKAFDATWAKEFRRAAEIVWRRWAYDPGYWCDAERRFTVPDLFRLAFRQWIVTGEVLAMLPWMASRRGYGRARYATTLQILDADRLTNPNTGPDTATMRAGVEIDAGGMPVAYHIRRAYPGDAYQAVESMQWDRVPRETTFGRPLVIHFFEAERPGQYRSAGGIFSPILARMRMLAKYDQVELQAAVINAIFAAYLKSPNDISVVQDALDDMQGEGLSEYQKLRGAYHEDRRLSLNGARIISLFPGEELNTVTANRPSSNFAAFEASFLRHMSAQTGQSYEQASHDWSQSNYSSARGALLEAWRTMDRRRAQFSRGVATPVYGALLEEAMDRDELPLPDGAPDFAEARAAYSAALWMGPARGWIDPVKEAEAAKARREAGLSTLAMENFEQGQDWEEIIPQLAEEQRMLKDAGVVLPAAGAKPAQPPVATSEQANA